jgi:hypothetical protein
MQLTVPQRTIADTQSFPVDPDGVNQWLAKLDPSNSFEDAKEVYRGLRHSNRLHNDVHRRRAVIACFIPTLREMHATLLETCQAQPLPLTAEFFRRAQLLDGLLREEAFAFKILLADSPHPQADDARRAMQALAKQAEARVHVYTSIPEMLLLDAYQLYALAEEFALLDIKPSDESQTTGEHFAYILLLTIADTQQHRVRQITPLLNFLRQSAKLVIVTDQNPKHLTSSTHLAIHLEHGARPVPAASMTYTEHVRWLELSHVMSATDKQLAHARTEHTTLAGTEVLDRHSITRLRFTLARSRNRRTSRVILFEPQQVIIGHKAMCAFLHLAASKAKEDISTGDELPPVLHAINEEQWNMVNQTPQGACLVSSNCKAGMVQVGELVSLQMPDNTATVNENGKTSAMLGLIRWIKASDKTQLKIGIEYLAKGALPIGISRTDSDDIVADDALIVACKVRDKVLQTILLPSYLYQTGDRLTVSLNGKSRKVVLHKTLQSNGLFSHFSLIDE